MWIDRFFGWHTNREGLATQTGNGWVTLTLLCACNSQFKLKRMLSGRHKKKTLTQQADGEMGKRKAAIVKWLQRETMTSSKSDRRSPDRWWRRRLEDGWWHMVWADTPDARCQNYIRRKCECGHLIPLDVEWHAVVLLSRQTICSRAVKKSIWALRSHICRAAVAFLRVSNWNSSPVNIWTSYSPFQSEFGWSLKCQVLYKDIWWENT